MFQDHNDQGSDSCGLIVESRGFMSVLVCPPDIRRWFETDPDRLENQLFDLLNNPKSDSPQNVSLWITRFAHTHLSPDTILARESALIQQRIWISFALRYLHPLLTRSDHLVHYEALTGIIKNHYRVVQILIEGDTEEIIELLQSPLPDPISKPDDAPSFPKYLDRIADREERTFARNADKGRDQLIAALVNYFSQLDYKPFTEIIRTALSRKRAVAVHRALRSHYNRYHQLIDRSELDAELQHQILLSFAEFERRLDMVDDYRVWDLRILLGAEMGALFFILAMDLTPKTSLLLLLIQAFIIACLFYTRTTYAITDTITWADKELRIFSLALADHDDDSDISNNAVVST